MRTLAEEYLLGSDLAIRVVVGVDIEYSKSKRAAFSVWRAELQGPEGDKAWVVEPTIADQVKLVQSIALRNLTQHRYFVTMTASRIATRKLV